MKVLLPSLMMVLVAAYSQGVSVNVFEMSSKHRSKRSVFDLIAAVSCNTKCEPTIYDHYGCYCGFMGGGTPVDNIDRCCETHDQCYTDAICHPKSSYYLLRYNYKCENNNFICKTRPERLCASALCKCDKEFAECLAKEECPTEKKMCPEDSIQRK